MDKKLYAISAVAQNGAIGKDGDIPWHIPEDFKLFKGYTLGKDMIMGRGTFESLPGILPKRRHIVVSSTMDSHPDNRVLVVPTIEDAIDEAVDGSFFCGGEGIYRAALNYIKEMYISHVHKTIPDADTFFPVTDFSQYPVLEERTFDDFTFRRYLVNQ